MCILYTVSVNLWNILYTYFCLYVFAGLYHCMYCKNIYYYFFRLHGAGSSFILLFYNIVVLCPIDRIEWVVLLLVIKYVIRDSNFALIQYINFRWTATMRVALVCFLHYILATVFTTPFACIFSKVNSSRIIMHG